MEEEGEGLSPLPNRLDNYEISNVDIVSLYPAQNFFTEYPIGHPRVIVRDEPVHWSKPKHNPHRGIIKCFIVPPRELLIPVVPKRVAGKLMFPLCNSCAADSTRKSKRMPRKASSIPASILCNHSTDKKRGFVSTLTHLELNLALSKGYVVKKIYSVYEWTRWSSELFRPYVQEFMKLKVEASGWPLDCLVHPVNQRRYVEEYSRRFGITIDAESVKKNEAMKYVAKL